MPKEGKAADTFGAVLINAKGQVLLREPTGHFGGYAWTFTKGRAREGESPAEAALRHILNDTGWTAEILAEIPGTFAGTTSTASFFLAGRIGKPGDHDQNTAALRWADFEDAEDLIRLTPNEVGRERDIAILRAAEGVSLHLPWTSRAAACEEDGGGFIKPMPERRTEIPVDLRYSEGRMRLLRKGFYPSGDDDKWFMWFADDVLHMHRSWTGLCIYHVPFHQTAHGWRATTAIVNRDPREHAETRDEVDEQLIEEMIDLHLFREPWSIPGASTTQVLPLPPAAPTDAGAALGDNEGIRHRRAECSPLDVEADGAPAVFEDALALAEQSNYLGSPIVMTELIGAVINAAIDNFKETACFNEVWDLIWNMSNEIATGERYIHVPGWYTPERLGAALKRYFHVVDECTDGGDLQQLISEALMVVFLQARELLNDFIFDPSAEWHKHAVPQLVGLRAWSVSAFLGVNEDTDPGVTVADFLWRPAGQ